jgi:hypothetical protein
MEERLMTISRAQMESQLKGGTMKKKKPVQKKFLGGAMLGGMAKDGAIPLMGILPMAYNAMQKKKKKADNSEQEAGMAAAKRNRQLMQAAAARGQQPRKMKDGGKTSRGDGICVKGKTKGRMV